MSEVDARARAVLAALRGGLVVSCQALPDEPMHGPPIMAAVAASVVAGGAVGVRANGPEDIAAIAARVEVPLIGLEKDDSGRFPVRITPSFAHAERVAAAGASIIALDATATADPPGGLAAFIAAVRERIGRPVLADISTLDEARAAVAAGADAVATTLAGYTAGTEPRPGPDLALVERCVAALEVPVIAEGRYRHGEDVVRALDLGAHCVVVGTAITRPEAITAAFVAQVQQRVPAG
jgi:N-acylglucosamine-6-phosphate 2-epimerase